MRTFNEVGSERCERSEILEEGIQMVKRPLPSPMLSQELHIHLRSMTIQNVRIDADTKDGLAQLRHRRRERNT